jgi:hypothetical protein
MTFEEPARELEPLFRGRTRESETKGVSFNSSEGQRSFTSERILILVLVFLLGISVSSHLYSQANNNRDIMNLDGGLRGATLAPKPTDGIVEEPTLVVSDLMTLLVCCLMV